LLKKGVHIGDPKLLTGITIAIVMALINVLLKPVLVALTLPLTIGSFGMFLIVINAVLILIVDGLLDNFQVDSFWWAILFSLLVSATTSIVSAIGHTKVIHKNKDDDFTDYEEV
jgi:putative membrane protein